MKDKKLASILENKYEEEFSILVNEGSWLSPKVSFEAAPKNRPELIFSGKFHKKTDKLDDYYRSTKLGALADSWMENHLLSKYNKAVLKSEIRCVDKPGPVEDIDEIFNKEASDLDVITRMYIFESLTENNKENLLQPIVNVSQILNEKGIDNVVFDITFFDESEFIEDNLSSYSFGFNITKDGDFEYSDKFSARTERIMFKVPADSKVPSVDYLYEIRLKDVSRPEYHIVDN